MGNEGTEHGNEGIVATEDNTGADNVIPQSPEPPDPEVGSPGEPGEPGKNKGGLQDRINKLTKDRGNAEREAAYWKGVADSNSRTTQTVQPPESKPEEEELDREDFDTDSEYLQAIVHKTKKEVQETLLESQRNNELAKSQEDIRKKYEEARVKYPDFDSVALSASVPITQEMFDASKGDSFGDILYHLGKNPEAARRISGLSSTQQIKEIGKIETILTIPIKKKGTNAPSPPNVITSGGSIPEKNDEDKTRAELHAKWEGQRRKRAGLT